MILKKRQIACIAAVALGSGSALPATGAPWTRGFVVSNYEYAFRYGGRSDFGRKGEVEPGVDCPHGSTVAFANPDVIRATLSRQKWRSQEEIDWVARPPGLDQARTPGEAREAIWSRALSYR
jgi:hypothetical protein